MLTGESLLFWSLDTFTLRATEVPGLLKETPLVLQCPFTVAMLAAFIKWKRIIQLFSYVSFSTPMNLNQVQDGMV